MCMFYYDNRFVYSCSASLLRHVGGFVVGMGHSEYTAGCCWLCAFDITNIRISPACVDLQAFQQIVVGFSSLNLHHAPGMRQICNRSAAAEKKMQDWTVGRDITCEGPVRYFGHINMCNAFFVAFNTGSGAHCLRSDMEKWAIRGGWQPMPPHRPPCTVTEEEKGRIMCNLTKYVWRFMPLFVGANVVGLEKREVWGTAMCGIHISALDRLGVESQGAAFHRRKKYCPLQPSCNENILTRPRYACVPLAMMF